MLFSVSKCPSIHFLEVAAFFISFFRSWTCNRVNNVMHCATRFTFFSCFLFPSTISKCTQKTPQLNRVSSNFRFRNLRTTMKRERQNEEEQFKARTKRSIRRYLGRRCPKYKNQLAKHRRDVRERNRLKQTLEAITRAVCSIISLFFFKV